jgi:type I restriction enzyme M protein
VLPHGVLFRGGAEQHIRRYLIETKNYLDAVIGLPANIFYGTSIPTCIMVFKKCREYPKNVLFMDASNGFEKVKTQNILRTADIDKIISTYRNRATIEKFSKVVETQVIASQDFNLNIPRYVDTFEVEESIDIQHIAQQIKDLDQNMKRINSTIAGFCAELGIDTPF